MLKFSKDNIFICSKLSHLWRESVYDNGDTEYLDDKRVSGLDYQR